MEKAFGATISCDTYFESYYKWFKTIHILNWFMVQNYTYFKVAYGLYQRFPTFSEPPPPLEEISKTPPKHKTFKCSNKNLLFYRNLHKK